MRASFGLNRGEGLDFEFIVDVAPGQIIDEDYLVTRMGEVPATPADLPGS